MISCESIRNSPLGRDCDSSSECDNTATQITQNTTTQMACENAITPEWVLATVARGSDCEFEGMLVQLGAVVGRPDFQQVLLSKELHYRMMKCFYRCFREMAEESEEQQHRLLFILSLLAEIARRQQKVRLPFTRKIVQALLSFDCHLLTNSHYGQQIITILAVLLENLARQGRAAAKLAVHHETKNGLLLLMGKADELSALQILLRAIKQLVDSTGLSISAEELEERGVAAAMRCTWGDLAAARLKVHLCRLSSKRAGAHGKTLKDLIEHF